MGSGKNLVGSMLALVAELHDLTTRQLSFAGELKEFAENILGWDGKKDTVGRFLLQTSGHAFRQQDPRYWIKFVEAELRNFSQNFVTNEEWLAIITDVRYKNEAAWIMEQGGHVWRIESSGTLKGKCSKFVPFGTNHASETDLDGWEPSHKIVNKIGSLEETYKIVCLSFEHFLKNPNAQ
jgi:hypothetical protein